MKKVKDLIEKNFIKSKNIWLAYLLAIFFGAFGLHRFYLKKNGLKMLLITVLTLGLGVIITYPILILDLIRIPSWVEECNENNLTPPTEKNMQTNQFNKHINNIASTTLNESMSTSSSLSNSLNANIEETNSSNVDKPRNSQIISYDFKPKLQPVMEFKPKTRTKKKSTRTKTNSSETIKISRLRKLRDDYVVVDIETTGLSPIEDKIIQLSAIKYIDNKKIAVFNEYINPHTKLSDFIINLTGITQDVVDHGKELDDIKDDFISFYGDLPLVGHYINGFDIKFLIANNLIIKNVATIDTLPLARKLDLENAKLPTVKKFLGIDNNSHDSLDDCYTTNVLYQFAKENF
ncbi:NINE protein [Lactobacillus salivarius]|uniref:exonuclease domain-containing protein n=1 Tax=Ligilactobacillus salivarius TaxID=1624 RepID=UPI00136BD7EE|nr:exonuclease domain-containing protein [Ligilactobacillus salivarius]MYU49125.1 NINE protein [Ligilactobacillus salivarius]